MARKYGNNNNSKIERGKKIAHMHISEVKERLDLYKEFKNSKYYQHLQDRFNALTS